MDVLLSFVGTRDPRWQNKKDKSLMDGPILSLVSKRPFARIILFANAGTIGQAAATRESLLSSYEYDESDVQIKELPFKDPTDYVSILSGLRNHIPECVKARPLARYFFAGSSGTPQMQASAMLLVMSGFIDAKFLLTRESQFDGPPVREFDFSEPEFPRVSFWSRELEAERIPASQLMQKAKDIGIIGDHAKLKEALHAAEDYARYDCPVLLLGETGTGKELFAKFIHDRSDRSKEAYIKVNCAELPVSIAESELFGHEKGAFTGAAQLKLGLMEAAKGGSLFLDELPHLRQEVQAKLLRAADQRTIKRLGGLQEIKVNVRLIFGTNKDLRKLEEEGQFLPDLRYRIGQSRVKIPALRDRRSDIPSLAKHFLERFAARTGEKFELTDAAMRILLRYSWPGNVRELEKLIEDSCMRADTRLLDAGDIKIDDEEAPVRPLPALPDPYDGFSLDTFEKDVRGYYMRRALECAGGRNKSQAARLLGMEPAAFHKYWKEHNLNLNKS